MAITFPVQPRQGTQSRKERELFRWLKRKLTDDFVMMHGVRFINQPGDYYRRNEREIDFLIIHPHHGIIVLEVKAGAVEYNPITGRWIIGQQNRESPFDQVRDELYSLRGYLREHEETASLEKKLHFERAIWFLDCKKEKVHLPDIAEASLLFWDDRVFGNPNELFLQIFERMGANKHPLTQPELDRLTKFLAPPLSFQSNLKVAMRQENKEMYELTAEQFKTLWQIKHERRLMIRGSAGTGKTILAYEAAWRFARGLKGKAERVLLLCNSEFTAQRLWRYYDLAKNPKPVFDIHYPQSLTNWFVQEARKEEGAQNLLRELDLTSTKNQSNLCGLLRNCEKILGPHYNKDWHYDTIIIDEGQDIEYVLFEAIIELLRDPNQSRLYVFYDEGQRIDFDTQWQTPLAPEIKMVTLHTNCRNTREIFSLMQRFHPASYLKPLISRYSPLGEPATLLPIDAEKTHSPQNREQIEAETLLRLLDQLINVDKINPHHILIVTCRLKDTPKQAPKKAPPRKVSQFRSWQTNTQWQEKGMLIRYMGDGRSDERSIPVLSLGSSKGLEMHVVILVELDGLPQDRKMRDKHLYIAISRCRHRLYAIGTEEELKEFQNL